MTAKMSFLVLAMGVLTAVQSQAYAMANNYVRLRDADGKLLSVISAQGTRIDPQAVENGLAPRGSAALTSSGALAGQGIRYVIHAASGSMTFDAENLKPTLEGIQLSIANSIRIATREKIQRIAIPLIGGGIFLNRLGLSKEELAYKIIDAARQQKTSVQIVFVAYSEDEIEAMTGAFKKQQDDRANDKLAQIWTYLKVKFLGQTDFFDRAQIVHGSITDFKLHGAQAIVNAANTELVFGGGISGVIGKATQDSEAIDQTGKELIVDLYQLNH
jgi:O-acetyl-ADP-ribose deacetylase (regulator of RNase III)